jgi:hypothetical protein
VPDLTFPGAPGLSMDDSWDDPVRMPRRRSTLGKANRRTKRAAVKRTKRAVVKHGLKRPAKCIQSAGKGDVPRPIRISGDCTGLDSGILSLRALGLGSRIKEGFASDINPHVRTFLQANFEHTHIFKDIVTRDNEKLKKQLAATDNIPDIYTAGWPCQPFSRAGLQKGVQDMRGTVGAFVADTIVEIRPRRQKILLLYIIIDKDLKYYYYNIYVKLYLNIN